MLGAKFTKCYDLIDEKCSFGAVFQKIYFKNISSLAINVKLSKVSPVHKRKFWYPFYHVSMNIDIFIKK